MKTDNIVTIWHFDDSDSPVRKVFKNVTMDSTKRIDKNGIKQKGFFDGSNAVIRIFTVQEIEVMPRDYLFIGESFEAYPMSEDCLKIVEVKDNRRGCQKHWRIVCGG